MKTIRDLFPGTIVKLERNGALEDWIVTSIADDRSVVLLRGVLLSARRMHSSNVSVYDGCEMDLWLENEETGFLSTFSEEMRSCLVSREIQTYTYGETETHNIARRCFLLSEDNLFDNNTVETEPFLITDFMKVNKTETANTARIGRDANGTDQYWWLRSPYSAAQFRFVYTSGAAGNSNATSSIYVRPALSVASATIISEADGIIRLLPDTENPYRYIDVTGYAGQSLSRPVKARVIVDAVNLSDVTVEVSNNAKDAEPVWVDCTGGVSVELANDTKTSEQWEVGVRLRGKANNMGYFTEPVVLLEV